MKTAEEWLSKMPEWDDWPPTFNRGNYLDWIKQIQRDALLEAAEIVQKRSDDYDSEHGFTDLETGTREYPKGGDEYMIELEDIKQAILTRAKEI